MEARLPLQVTATIRLLQPLLRRKETSQAPQVIKRDICMHNIVMKATNKTLTII